MGNGLPGRRKVEPGLRSTSYNRREHGVEDVWVFATHGNFCGDALEKFADSDISGIVVTDTVPIDPIAKPENMTIMPVAPLLAETIMNVFADDSVSAIFGGENQLF